MQALILAGGQGTRLRPLTIHTPKPIVPIANRPFLQYQLDILKEAGVTDVTLTLSYKPEKIVDMFANSTAGLLINYTVEDKPLGTAGAFKLAEDRIKETTIVFNGDILTNIDLNSIVSEHKQRGAVATLVLVPVEDPSSYGLVETDSSGRVVRFIEKPKSDQITCNTINAGIYILEPSVLKYIPAHQPHMFEYGLFPRLLKEGEKVYSHISRDYWLDIGTNQRYLEANLDVINGKLRYRPQRTETLDNIDIDGQSIIDSSCSIKGRAKVRNSVVGANCTIGDDVFISDSVIQDNTTIESSVVINRSIVGKGSIIGESVKIGPGAVLGYKTIITDFSILGE